MLLDTNSTVVSCLKRGFFLRIRTCCKNAKGVSPPKLHAMYLRKPWRVLAIWFCSHLKSGHLITPRRHPFATIGKVILYVQYCISTHWVDTASKTKTTVATVCFDPLHVHIFHHCLTGQDSMIFLEEFFESITIIDHILR